MEGGGEMGAGIPARLTTTEGRKFGLTVGGAFIVFGLLLWWRKHVYVASVLGFLGGGLVVWGLILPTRMGTILRLWMGLAHAISRVTTPVFMGIVYFALITPIGFLIRLFGKDPLKQHGKSGSFWVPRPSGEGRARGMERQF